MPIKVGWVDTNKGDDEVEEHLLDIIGQHRVWIGFHTTNGFWEGTDCSPFNSINDKKEDNSKTCVGLSKADHLQKGWMSLDCNTSCWNWCRHNLELRQIKGLAEMLMDLDYTV